MSLGFSTILAPTFLKIPVSITSVDFNPQKYHRILSSRTATKSFLNRIDFQSQITVSLAEVNTCLQEITEALEQTDSKPINTALSTFGYNNKFNRERLINDFQSHPSYMEEVHFYNQHAATSGQKFCSNLAASQTRYNAYFFDCGEISSVAEFWILQRKMMVGDYVLLHDIKYPKSIKNFIVATFLIISKEWNILYLDTETPQGGLVAKRIA